MRLITWHDKTWKKGAKIRTCLIPPPPPPLVQPWRLFRTASWCWALGLLQNEVCDSAARRELHGVAIILYPSPQRAFDIFLCQITSPVAEFRQCTHRPQPTYTTWPSWELDALGGSVKTEGMLRPPPGQSYFHNCSPVAMSMPMHLPNVQDTTTCFSANGSSYAGGLSSRRPPREWSVICVFSVLLGVHITATSSMPQPCFYQHGAWCTGSLCLLASCSAIGLRL